MHSLLPPDDVISFEDFAVMLGRDKGN
eukprot:SAG22_NODE_10759_length_517_cov_0.990431_1_plen_26_part_10